MNQERLNGLWKAIEATACEQFAVNFDGLSVVFIHASAALQAMIVFPSGYQQGVIQDGNIPVAGRHGPVMYVRKREDEGCDWEVWQSCEVDVPP